MFENIKNKYNPYEIQNKKQNLIKINNMIKNIITYKEEIIKMIILIKEKYEVFFYLMNSICEIKLSLYLLKKCENDNKNLQLDEVFNSFKILESSLYEDYEKNLEFNEESVKNIIAYTAKLIKNNDNTKIFKFFLKQLIFFANKFRNENKKILICIENAKKLYESSNYIEGINIILRTLEIIKNSAKKNHILKI
jgi:hypothetical protein